MSFVARAEPLNDLREFRVGMPVADLPASGYVGLACAEAPKQTLNSWTQYATCPKDARGLHVVSFRYDDAANPMTRVGEQYKGTKVAGHPVLAALLIGDDGLVDGIRIDTDPNARLYLRKKAFLFADQVKARYGEEGWNCTEAKPTGDKEPLGGVFIDRHCEKTTPDRHLIMDQELYRRGGRPIEDFVGGTQLTILRAGNAGNKG